MPNPTPPAEISVAKIKEALKDYLKHLHRDKKLELVDSGDSRRYITDTMNERINQTKAIIATLNNTSLTNENKLHAVVNWYYQNGIFRNPLDRLVTPSGHSKFVNIIKGEIKHIPSVAPLIYECDKYIKQLSSTKSKPMHAKRIEFLKEMRDTLTDNKTPLADKLAAFSLKFEEGKKTVFKDNRSATKKFLIAAGVALSGLLSFGFLPVGYALASKMHPSQGTAKFWLNKHGIFNERVRHQLDKSAKLTPSHRHRTKGIR